MKTEEDIRRLYDWYSNEYRGYVRSACLNGLREGDVAITIAFEQFGIAKIAYDKMKVLEEILGEVKR